MWARLDILLGAYELSLTPFQMSQRGGVHVGRGIKLIRAATSNSSSKDMDGVDSLAFAVD